MNYRSTLNESHEAAGIAYNTACVYALGKLDEGLWNDVQRKCERSEFSAMEWEATPKLVHMKGPRGKEALRFAWQDRTGVYLRFRSGPKPPVYSSVALLKASVYEPFEFLRARLAGPFLAARKPLKNNWQGRGLHVGSLERSVSALLVIESLTAEQRRLRIIDVQPDQGSAKHEFTITSALSADDEQAERAAFGRLVDSGEIIPEPTINTLLLLGSRASAPALGDQPSTAGGGCPSFVSI